MTRLKTDDIRNIVTELDRYDEELIRKTGCTLAALAGRAAGVPDGDFKSFRENTRVGVIPFTGEKGRIAGFCETVAGIVSHLGFKTMVARDADAAGLAEAYEKKMEIIILADDLRFIAIHTPSRRVVDNAAATARGFVTGLSLMAGGLKQKKVLVLGCGKVGFRAAEALSLMDARVSVHDIEHRRSRVLAEKIKRTTGNKIHILETSHREVLDYDCIVDATPAKDIIKKHHVSSETFIAAPGVPCGVSADVVSAVSDRLLHDPLQIGVATMVFSALAFCR